MFAFFSYPFSVLPLTVLFVMLVAAAAAWSPPVGRRLSRLSTVAVAIICLCLAGYASTEILMRYPAYRQWNRVQMDFDSGHFEKAIDDYHRLYRKLDREKMFLFEYVRCLTFTGQYTKSNDVLDR
jgi:hypothetical protein